MTLKNNSLLLLLCLKTAHGWLCYRSPTGEFVDANSLMKMPTGCFVDVVRLGCFVDVFETFILTTTVNFIDISPPFSAKRRYNLLQIIYELPPSGVGVFHWCTPPSNCTRVPSSFLVFAAICVSEFDRKTYTILWLWMTIPKDQSSHNVSSICLIFGGCDILLRNDWACHNGNTDGDQNTDLPNDRLFDNESISVEHELQVACNFVCLQLSQNLMRWVVQEILHSQT